MSMCHMGWVAGFSAGRGWSPMRIVSLLFAYGSGNDNNFGLDIFARPGKSEDAGNWRPLPKKDWRNHEAAKLPLPPLSLDKLCDR